MSVYISNMIILCHCVYILAYMCMHTCLEYNWGRYHLETQWLETCQVLMEWLVELCPGQCLACRGCTHRVWWVIILRHRLEWEVAWTLEAYQCREVLLLPTNSNRFISWISYCIMMFSVAYKSLHLIYALTVRTVEKERCRNGDSWLSSTAKAAANVR